MLEKRRNVMCRYIILNQSICHRQTKVLIHPLGSASSSSRHKWWTNWLTKMAFSCIFAFGRWVHVGIISTSHISTGYICTKRRPDLLSELHLCASSSIRLFSLHWPEKVHPEWGCKQPQPPCLWHPPQGNNGEMFFILKCLNIYCHPAHSLCALWLNVTRLLLQFTKEEITIMSKILSRWFQIYCRTDQMCICPDCETENHQDHDTVSVETEWMETKVGKQITDRETKDRLMFGVTHVDSRKLTFSFTQRTMDLTRTTMKS